MPLEKMRTFLAPMGLFGLNTLLGLVAFSVSVGRGWIAGGPPVGVVGSELMNVGTKTLRSINPVMF